VSGSWIARVRVESERRVSVREVRVGVGTTVPLPQNCFVLVETSEWEWEKA